MSVTSTRRSRRSGTARTYVSLDRAGAPTDLGLDQPTSYTVAYDAAANEYRVALSGPMSR